MNDAEKVNLHKSFLRKNVALWSFRLADRPHLTNMVVRGCCAPWPTYLRLISKLWVNQIVCNVTPGLNFTRVSIRIVS